MSVFPKEFPQKIAEHFSEKSRCSKEVKEKFKECLKKTKEDADDKETPVSLLAQMNGNVFVESRSGLDWVEAQSVSAVSVNLNTELEVLFEKMASCMIVMSSGNESETTFFLDQTQFHPDLLGTQITIKEFSTAPKAFNIEIISNPQALALINAGRSGLFAAFAKGNFNFTVNRLDTCLEKPAAIRRKENAAEEQKEEGGA